MTLSATVNQSQKKKNGLSMLWPSVTDCKGKPGNQSIGNAALAFTDMGFYVCCDHDTEKKEEDEKIPERGGRPHCSHRLNKKRKKAKKRTCDVRIYCISPFTQKKQSRRWRAMLLPQKEKKEERGGPTPPALQFHPSLAKKRPVTLSNFWPIYLSREKMKMTQNFRHDR